MEIQDGKKLSNGKHVLLTKRKTMQDASSCIQGKGRNAVGNGQSILLLFLVGSTSAESLVDQSC